MADSTWKTRFPITAFMISGHSLQGLIGVSTVMERILATGITLREDSWQAISEQSLVFQLVEDSGREAYAPGFE
jgi:hypothetical protein